MKTLLALLVLIATVIHSRAQGGFVVVPGGLADVEGNSSSGDLFTTNSRTWLQVFSASEFGLPPGSSGIVNRVALRLDSAQTPIVGSWYIAIVLFACPRSVDSLSPWYVENRVNEDNVFDRRELIGLEGTNGSVQPFFEFNIRPYVYQPHLGNLGMQIWASTGTNTIRLDAQDTVGDSVSRVYGGTGGGIASGTADTLGLVTRFYVIPVPEARWHILMAAMLLVGLATSRWSKRP